MGADALKRCERRRDADRRKYVKLKADPMRWAEYLARRRGARNKEYNHRSYAKLKADPLKWAERLARQKRRSKEANRRNYIKTKADPVLLAKHLERRRRLNPEKRKENKRRYYTKLKRDPVRWAKHLARYVRKGRVHKVKTKDEVREKDRERYHRRDLASRKVTRRRQYAKVKADPVKWAKVLASNRAWEKAHPEKVTEKRARRRARKAGVESEPLSRIIVADRDGWKCCYCGVSLTKKTLTLDHVRPISKGGPHTYANVVAACKPCNSSKGAKIIERVVTA